MASSLITGLKNLTGKTIELATNPVETIRFRSRAADPNYYFDNLAKLGTLNSEGGLKIRLKHKASDNIPTSQDSSRSNPEIEIFKRRQLDKFVSDIGKVVKKPLLMQQLFRLSNLQNLELIISSIVNLYNSDPIYSGNPKLYHFLNVFISESFLNSLSLRIHDTDPPELKERKKVFIKIKKVIFDSIYNQIKNPFKKDKGKIIHNLQWLTLLVNLDTRTHKTFQDEFKIYLLLKDDLIETAFEQNNFKIDKVKKAISVKIAEKLNAKENEGAINVSRTRDWLIKKPLATIDRDFIQRVRSILDGSGEGASLVISNALANPADNAQPAQVIPVTLPNATQQNLNNGEFLNQDSNLTRHIVQIDGFYGELIPVTESDYLPHNPDARLEIDFQTQEDFENWVNDNGYVDELHINLTAMSSLPYFVSRPSLSEPDTYMYGVNEKVAPFVFDPGEMGVSRGIVDPRLRDVPPLQRPEFILNPTNNVQFKRATTVAWLMSEDTFGGLAAISESYKDPESQARLYKNIIRSILMFMKEDRIVDGKFSVQNLRRYLDSQSYNFFQEPFIFRENVEAYCSLDFFLGFDFVRNPPNDDESLFTNNEALREYFEFIHNYPYGDRTAALEKLIRESNFENIWEDRLEILQNALDNNLPWERKFDHWVEYLFKLINLAGDEVTPGGLIKFFQRADLAPSGRPIPADHQPFVPPAGYNGQPPVIPAIPGLNNPPPPGPDDTPVNLKINIPKRVPVVQPETQQNPLSKIIMRYGYHIQDYITKELGLNQSEMIKIYQKLTDMPPTFFEYVDSMRIEGSRVADEFKAQFILMVVCLDADFGMYMPHTRDYQFFLDEFGNDIDHSEWFSPFSGNSISMDSLKGSNLASGKQIQIDSFGVAREMNPGIILPPDNTHKDKDSILVYKSPDGNSYLTFSTVTLRTRNDDRDMVKERYKTICKIDSNFYEIMKKMMSKMDSSIKDIFAQAFVFSTKDPKLKFDNPQVIVSPITNPISAETKPLSVQSPETPKKQSPTEKYLPSLRNYISNDLGLGLFAMLKIEQKLASMSPTFFKYIDSLQIEGRDLSDTEKTQFIILILSADQVFGIYLPFVRIYQFFYDEDSKSRNPNRRYMPRDFKEWRNPLTGEFVHGVENGIGDGWEGKITKVNPDSSIIDFGAIGLEDLPTKIEDKFHNNQSSILIYNAPSNGYVTFSVETKVLPTEHRATQKGRIKAMFKIDPNFKMIAESLLQKMPEELKEVFAEAFVYPAANPKLSFRE